MLQGKVSIERDGDPTSLVHMATGQAVIEAAVQKSGVREQFFDDRAIAALETENEQQRQLALDSAIAMSLAAEDDARRHHRRRRKPQKRELSKSDALLLLKSLEDCALIAPALRQTVSKRLVNADDGVLALLNAFHADPLTLASELVAHFGGDDNRAASSDSLPPPPRAVRFADGTKAQAAAPSRPKRTKKSKKKKSSSSRPEPSASSSPFMDSPANRAFEERLKKIREGV